MSKLVYNDKKVEIALKVVFGSQNFGYDTVESDIDHLLFFYPSFMDLTFGKIDRFEITENDGSITKCYDIRQLEKMIYKANMTDLQVLFSLNKIEDNHWFNWFLENRQELLTVNPYNLYVSNMGLIRNRIKLGTHKDLVSALAIARLVIKAKQYISEKIPFEFLDTSLRDIRNTWNDSCILHEINILLEELSSPEYETYFEQYKEYTNTYYINLIKVKIANELANRYRVRDVWDASIIKEQEI